MSIKFLGTKVSRLSIEVDESKDEPNQKNNFELSFAGLSDDSDDKAFAVRFTVKVFSEEERYLLELEYSGFFTTEDAITDSFMQSHFVTSNAPAIAFPFLRSFVNTVTVNAGLKPLILPTLNFQKMVRDQQNQSSLPSKPEE